MLYIWPLFAFFSAPLLLPSAVSAILRPVRYLRSLLNISYGRSSSRWSSVLTATSTLLTILLSLAVVRYNTIIHPFTLADNRHYMFYVFRYTILRSPSVRLALVAAYTLCRWLAWDALAGGNTLGPKKPSQTDLVFNNKKNSNNKEAGTNPDPGPNRVEDTLAVSPTSPPPPRTSTALLWLLATALSLITAPLVEPRYFILPWVFYRLLVPPWPSSSSSSSEEGAGSGSGTSGSGKKTRRHGSAHEGRWWWKESVERQVDVRLVLETVWFLAVNAGTMYVFLFKPFYWRGKDGEVLDGGRVQRFMW
jgi:alpha-1,2-glucosyltransferase